MTLTIPRGDKTPIIWVIAGSDSSGGAGLQTDLKTITALGGHACTLVTSVTAQGTDAVVGFESVSPQILQAQINALGADLPPAAIKIGMLGDATGVCILANVLQKIKTYTIYDPVLISSSGTRLLSEETLIAMREQLCPHVNLLTPNLVEAAALTDTTIRRDADIEVAAEILLKSGIKSVFIKGWDSGHGFVQDYFSDGAQRFWLTLPKYVGEVPRGTGCMLASAIATAHGFGFDAADACVIGKAYTHRALRLNKKLGKGPPIAAHFPWPQNVNTADFPWLTKTAEAGRVRPAFPDCGTRPLGFYPIVDHAAWLQRLLPLGITTAQWRGKHFNGDTLEQEIAAAIKVGRKHETRLFINDYWQLAIKHGAYGVHLGQEDLDNADIAAIAASGLRLGISTHSYAELAAALALNPSYIALGPIFPTTLKSMRFAPQGIETLRIWRQLTDKPLVAIGGIKLEQAEAIYAMGADSIAVVSDVTQNDNPEARVKAWLQLTEM